MAAQIAVKTFLKSKHIEVPDEWISACLEWIQSEDSGHNVGNTRILSEKVYEQWLYCDLTELASSCLPFGLPERRSSTISGRFALQVNQVRDVGHPAYAQLQSVRRADNANAAVSAERPHQPAWEPKPSRMLLLQMTDGTSIVQGMERGAIPALNVNIRPGAKVLLSGTIATRRGMLLLSREHVTLLGGEVESLLVPNAMENVLARHLGTEETEQPRQCEEAPPTQIHPSQSSQYYPSQINSSAPHGSCLQRPRTQPLSRPSADTKTSGPSSNNLDDLGDDDFLDPDLEAALDRIESQSSVAPSQDLAPSHDADDDALFLGDDFDDAILLSAEARVDGPSTPFGGGARVPESSGTPQRSPYDVREGRRTAQGRRSPLRGTPRSAAGGTKPSKGQSIQLSLEGFLSKPSQPVGGIRPTDPKRNDGVDADDSMGCSLPKPLETPRLKQTSRTNRCNGIKSGSAGDRAKRMPPFTYLFFLPERPSVTQDFVVKGFIMTLVSRLEQTGGGWSLAVLINDGTASREVDVDDLVLQDLIGMSAEQMKQRKIEAKSDPGLRSQLAKVVGGCQQKLISLCCLLHLRASPDAGRPRLTSVSSVTTATAQRLSERLGAASSSLGF